MSKLYLQLHFSNMLNLFDIGVTMHHLIIWIYCEFLYQNIDNMQAPKTVFKKYFEINA